VAVLATGVSAAVAVTAVAVARRWWRRTRRPDLRSLRTSARGGPRGPVCVIGDSLTFERIDDLMDALTAAGFGPVRVDARPGRRCVRDVPMARSGVRAVTRARQAMDPATRWLVALGQNDADDTAPGAGHALVAGVLDAIGPAAVVWLDVVTVPPAASPAAFGAAIVEACGARAGVRVARWSAVAAGRTAWFAADGIHHTPEGTAARNRFIVEQLVAAG